MTETIPEDPLAETAFLASVSGTGSEAILREFIGKVEAEDFVNPEHRAIWKALESFAASGEEEGGAFAIRRHMELNKGLQVPFNRIIEVLGSDYVLNPGFLASKLISKRQSRQIMKLGEWLMKNSEEPIEAAARANSALQNIQNRSDQSENVVCAGDYALELAMDGLPFSSNKGGNTVASTGITWIDNLVKMDRKTVSVIAARGGVGKTTWAIDVCARAARMGNKVRFYSLEMPKEDVLAKLASNVVGVDWNDIRKHGVPDHAMPDLAKNTDLLRRICIFEGFQKFPWRNIESDIIKHAQKGECDFVCLDYFEYIRPDGKSKDDHSNWSDLSSDIASLAKRYNIGVLLLAQLHRLEDGKEPSTANLARTDALQKDAANVIFLYVKDNDKYWAKLGKTRYGQKTSPRMVEFNGSLNRVDGLEFEPTNNKVQLYRPAQTRENE